MDYTELSLSNIHYYPPSKVNNRYISRVFYQEGHDEPVPLSIVTPALRAYSSVCISENRCYLILELDRQHEDLYNFLTALDDRNIKVMFQNSASWFGRTVPLDWLDDNYTTFIKAARPPQIKVRIPLHKGVPTIDVPNIEKGTLVKLVLEYQGIKFLRQQASNLWTVKDIRIIDDNEDIEYNFHRYEDDMGDLMLQELNLTIQEAISKANRSVPVKSVSLEQGGFIEEENFEEENVEEENIEEENVEEENVEEENVEEENVEEENVEEGNVEEGNFVGEVEENVAEEFEEENVAEEVEEDDYGDEGSDYILEDDGIESEELFDNLVDRVIDDVVDHDVLDSSSDSGRRRRKKIVVGNRVRII